MILSLSLEKPNLTERAAHTDRWQNLCVRKWREKNTNVCGLKFAALVLELVTEGKDRMD